MTPEEKEDFEEGLTKAQEKLPEPLKKAILKFNGESSDSEEEDVEESIKEGNEFAVKLQEKTEIQKEMGGKHTNLKQK